MGGAPEGVQAGVVARCLHHHAGLLVCAAADKQQQGVKAAEGRRQWRLVEELPGRPTPGSVDQQGHEGQEEEACDGDEAGQPLGQRTLGLSPACHRGQRSESLKS